MCAYLNNLLHFGSTEFCDLSLYIDAHSVSFLSMKYRIILCNVVTRSIGFRSQSMGQAAKVCQGNQIRSGETNVALSFSFSSR